MTVKVPIMMAAIHTTCRRSARAHADCGRRAASRSAQRVRARGTEARVASTSAPTRSDSVTARFYRPAGPLRSRPMPRLSQLSRSIEGRVAIVTGAASGMGRATAHLLADEGAAVAALDHTPGGASAVVDDIVANGGRAVAVDVDLADAEATIAAVAAAREALGPIDLLVNNAGLSRPAPIDQDGFDE